MKIKGTVTAITPDYPFQVTVGKQTFTSHFKFKVGWKINLTFEGDVFTHPWPSGFVESFPNGISDYVVTDREIAIAKGNDSIAKHLIRFGSRLQEVIATGVKKEWTMVESFYNYHYSAEFDPKTKILSTNWAVRHC